MQLTEKQIYKWGYEKKRRLNIDYKDPKTFNMHLVTQIDDLKYLNTIKDYNSLVEDLFPEHEKEVETLTDLQKQTYDLLRDKLIARWEEYEQQSDLDKRLNDRVPI